MVRSMTMRETLDFARRTLRYLRSFRVLKQSIAVFLTAIPVRVPSTDNSQAIADWIYFLSHLLSFSVFVINCVNNQCDVVCAFADTVATALRSSAETLEHRSTVYIDCADIELAGVSLAFVLGFPVGDSRAEELFEAGSSFLIRKFQDTECTVDLYPRTMSATRRILRGRWGCGSFAKATVFCSAFLRSAEFLFLTPILL